MQEGNLPLHIAAMRQQRSVVVVKLLLNAYQDGAKEKNTVNGRTATQDLAPLTSFQWILALYATHISFAV